MPKLEVEGRDVHGNSFKLAVSDLIWRPAAYAFVVEEGKLLLSKQFDGYDLPGGGIDLGETPEEAVIREVKEETGVDVANPRLITLGTTFTIRNNNQPIESLMIYFQCDYVGGELSTEGFDEFEKEYADMPEWIALDQLVNIKPASTNDYRQYLKLIEQHK